MRLTYAFRALTDEELRQLQIEIFEARKRLGALRPSQVPILTVDGLKRELEVLRALECGDPVFADTFPAEWAT
jgi:hypothetical protein